MFTRGERFTYMRKKIYNKNMLCRYGQRTCYFRIWNYILFVSKKTLDLRLQWQVYTVSSSSTVVFFHSPKNVSLIGESKLAMDVR